MWSRLLTTLSASLGASQAATELRWMRQAIDAGASTVSIDDMVARRVRGEPLQYILGNILLSSHPGPAADRLSH